MLNGQSHHVISRGQSPKFYRPEDLKDKGPGRTPWVIAFEEIIIGLYLALVGPVPYAFRTPDGKLRSLDAGCVKMILNRTPPELIITPGGDGYISSVSPSPELLARYSGREEELRRRVLDATSAERLSSTPDTSLPHSGTDHPSGSAAASISNSLQLWNSDLNIERALIIREPWISKILSGEKTWEMRSKPTSVRGWIGLVAQGTNQVVGLARLIGCELPLTARTYERHFAQHAIPADQTQWAIENNWVFPWVLADVIRLPRPVPIASRPGAVQFVNLDLDVVGALTAVAQAGAAAEPTPPAFPAAPPDTQTRHEGQTDSATEVRAGAQTKAETTSDVPVFVFAPQRARARAVPTGGKRLMVLKGSTAMRSGSPLVKRDQSYRDSLVRDGVLVPSDQADLFEFFQDHEFDSASRAAGIIKDGNSSGPQQWMHPETRKTLKDYFDQGGRL
jgi:hypothetical protein